MACTACVALPVCFMILFCSVVGAVYYLAVIKYKLVSYKTPFFCEAGAKKPAYYPFSMGISICSLLLVSTMIVQYLKREECAQTVDDEEFESTFKIFNIIALISGIGCGVSLCGMGVFSMHKFYTVHMVSTGFLMGFANFHIAWTTNCTESLSQVINDCIGSDGLNVDAIITTRWVFFVLIAITNCAVFGVIQYATALQKKQNSNVDMNGQTAEEMNKQRNEMISKVRRLLRGAAIGQYCYMFGFVTFFLLFIPTDLL